MASSPTEYFERIIAGATEALVDLVVLRREATPERAILEILGRWRTYRVRLLEIIPAEGARKYAYYVLDETGVVAGFDNASDPRALRIKYGPNYIAHRYELVPHFHGAHKTTLELTDEMDGTQFIAWMQVNVS